MLSGVWLGRVGYAPAVELQEDRRRQILDGTAPEVVFYLEHPDVITLGKSAARDILVDDAELAARGIVVHRTTRGGDVTYHGPGQLVVYAVVRVSSVLSHVAALAAGAVAVAASVGVEAELSRHPLGVFGAGGKLAAIGVHVQRRITTHGLALNVRTDLSRFDLIVPCGRPDIRPASLASEVDLPSLAAVFHAGFCRAAGRVAGQVDFARSSLLSDAPPL